MDRRRSLSDLILRPSTLWRWPYSLHVAYGAALFVVVLIGAGGDIGVVGGWVGTWAALVLDPPGLVLAVIVAFMARPRWGVLAVLVIAVALELRIALAWDRDAAISMMVHRLIALLGPYLLANACVLAWARRSSKS